MIFHALLGVYYGLKQDIDLCYRHHKKSIDLSPVIENYINFIESLIRAQDAQTARDYANYIASHLDNVAGIQHLIRIEIMTANFAQAIKESERYQALTKNPSQYAPLAQDANKLVEQDLQPDAHRLVHRWYQYLQSKGYLCFETNIQAFKNNSIEEWIQYNALLPVTSTQAAELTVNFMMEVELEDLGDKVLEPLAFQVYSIAEVAHHVY